MLLLRKSTYSIQGFSTEDLRPKGAVTPPPHSPPPPPLESYRLPSFLQQIPCPTAETQRKKRDGHSPSKLGHVTPPDNHTEATLLAIQSQQAWCLSAVHSPLSGLQAGLQQCFFLGGKVHASIPPAALSEDLAQYIKLDGWPLPSCASQGLTPIASGESIWGSRSKKDRLLKTQWS